MKKMTVAQKWVIIFIGPEIIANSHEPDYESTWSN